MTYLTNDGTAHIAVAESVQQDVALLGINLEIKSEDWNVFLEDRKSGTSPSRVRDGLQITTTRLTC